IYDHPCVRYSPSVSLNKQNRSKSQTSRREPMKSSSNVWSACFLALVMVAVAIPVAGQNTAGQPTPDQAARQAEQAQRLMLADQIEAENKTVLGGTYDTIFQNKIVRILERKPTNELNSTPAGGAVVAAAPGLGDSGDNLVYTPVAPCRI